MASATIETDNLNDLFLADGRNLVVLTGIDACVQNVRQATLLRLGEDIYNKTNGVDFFGAIFSPQVNYDAARKSIQQAILKVPDVLSIETLTITIDGNNFDYEADIVTAYGPTTVSTQ